MLNVPLRELGKAMANRADSNADAYRESHPLPVTISFLTAAIGKLRAVGADEGAVSRVDLWRGMRDTAVPASFMESGGTELAPMSTTTSMQMALQYALSERSLLLKLRTDSFMNRGASVKVFSAFPTESEVLYPPLTYLRPTTREERLMVSGHEVHVVEVVPAFGG